MTESGLISLVVVPIGLGLLGFIEPCSIGSTLLFIPACAAPLIFALLGAAVASGATGAMLAAGFASLALFGAALSLPLVLAVVFEPARRALDWLSDLSRRLPVWTGLLLIVLGMWSIGFALFVEVKA